MQVYKYYILCAVFILLTPFSRAYAFTTAPDQINVNTSWTVADSPYYVPTTTVVDEGVTLTIEPGVVVKFGIYSGIYVNGVLEANGTPSEPIIFTSYFDDSVGGDTNMDGEDTAPSSLDWKGISFFNTSLDSNISNIEMRFADYGLANFGKNLNVFDSKFSYMNSGLVSFDGSMNTLSNVTFRNIIRYAISLYNKSKLNGENINISYLDEYGDGIDLFEGSNLILKNSSLQGSIGSYGVLIFEGSDVDIDNTILSGFDVGIADFGDGDNDKDVLKINNSQIKNNDIGFLMFAEDSILDISNNAIQDNITYAVKSYAKAFLNFKNNYWGDFTGPLNSINPNGLGNSIYDIPDYNKVVFTPWLTLWPSEPIVCCSSIMFFPGVGGSRLYKERLVGGADQLWEASNPLDVADLYMDEEGGSINGVHTRDIIRKTNVVGNRFGVQFIYKSFSEDLDNLKSEGKISDWQPVPYDWRLSVDDIVENDVQLGNDTMNIIKDLEVMASNSQTGSITLVGHSDGGLLIKYLLKKLEDIGESSLIDKVILVGVPQYGTPQGIFGILHGQDFGAPFNILAPQKYSRMLAVNSPGAYGLLPSEKFFENNSAPLIHFDESVGDFSGLISGYGTNIDSYLDMRDFILSNSDDRDIPNFNTVDAPTIGNEFVYEKADNLHSIIDNYLIPPYIKSYEISGTGLPTPFGINYRKNKYCIFELCHGGSQIIPEIVHTIEGDGTVLNTSSAVMNDNKYYVDMNAYNRDNGVNLDHAFMFENNSVKKLVEDLSIDNEESIPYVIKKNSRPTVKTRSIGMHSPVDIDLYDSDGNHTGKCLENPYSDMDCVDEEIPNSSYSTAGEDKYIKLPGDGEYTLKLSGYDLGTFTLNIDIYDDDNKLDSVSFVDVPTNLGMKCSVIINDGMPTELLLDMDGDGILDKKVTNTGEISDIVHKKNKPKIIYGSVIQDMPLQNDIENVNMNKVANENFKNKVQRVIKNNPLVISNKENISVIPEVKDFNLSASVGNLNLFGIINYLFNLLFKY